MHPFVNTFTKLPFSARTLPQNRLYLATGHPALISDEYALLTKALSNPTTIFKRGMYITCTIINIYASHAKYLS